MYDEFYEMEKKIERKRERIIELRSLATSMTVNLCERVQTTPDDRMATIMCKLDTAERELTELLREVGWHKKMAYEEIKKLENEDWQDIVYLHYVELMPMTEIAKMKGTTVGSAYMKNNRAVKRLKKLLT